MKVLIVDDEKPACDRLQRMVGQMPAFEVVGQAYNGEQALELAQTSDADIVLLDIRMPRMDGIAAARHLAALEHPPAVIFTTAYADHALEAFETHAVDYLLKPVRKERLQAALEAASRPNRAQLAQQNEVLTSLEVRQHICARVRGNLVLVPIGNIYYFQADQKYVTVRHTGGEVLIEEPLIKLEKEFATDFCRIHRNALISLQRVRALRAENDSFQVLFEGIDNRLEVSRRHLPGIRKIIKNL